MMGVEEAQARLAAADPVAAKPVERGFVERDATAGAAEAPGDPFVDDHQDHEHQRRQHQHDGERPHPAERDQRGDGDGAGDSPGDREAAVARLQRGHLLLAHEQEVRVRLARISHGADPIRLARAVRRGRRPIFGRGGRGPVRTGD